MVICTGIIALCQQKQHSESNYTDNICFGVLLLPIFGGVADIISQCPAGVKNSLPNRCRQR